jgi:hypothetical protein
MFDIALVTTQSAQGKESSADLQISAVVDHDGRHPLAPSAESALHFDDLFFVCARHRMVSCPARAGNPLLGRPDALRPRDHRRAHGRRRQPCRAAHPPRYRNRRRGRARWSAASRDRPGGYGEGAAKTEQHAHLFDPYTGHLRRRCHEGERNATQLFREIQQLIYPGGELAVPRYLRQFRHGRGHAARLATTPRSARSSRTWPRGGPRDW